MRVPAKHIPIYMFSEGLAKVAGRKKGNLKHACVAVDAYARKHNLYQEGFIHCDEFLRKALKQKKIGMAAIGWVVLDHMKLIR